MVNKFYKQYSNALWNTVDIIDDFVLTSTKPGEPLYLEEIYVPVKLRLQLNVEQQLKHPDDRQTTPEIPYIPQSIDSDLKYLVEKLEEKTKQLPGKENKSEPPKEMTADEVTSQYTHLLISGQPGSGKTTLLKYLALRMLRELSAHEKPGKITHSRNQPGVNLPLLIPVPEWVQASCNLLEYLTSDLWVRQGLNKPPQNVEEILEQGKITLLLDGFDEPIAWKKRAHIVSQIDAFTQQYPSCPIILTSRSITYPVAKGNHNYGLSQFTRMELVEFDDYSMREFLDNFFSRLPEATGKRDVLIKLLSEKWNEDILALARNPGMLAIIATIFYEDDGALQRRANLLGKIVDRLLEPPPKHSHRAIHADFPASQKKLVLQKIAYHNHIRQRRTTTSAEILQFITQNIHLPDFGISEAHLMLEALEQHGFLIQQLFTGAYAFPRLLFQEYFTALELIEQDDRINILLPHLPEAWWEKTILFISGLADDAGPLVEEILDEAPDDIFFSNLMLSGKCAAEAGYMDPYLKEFIGRDLWTLYNTGDFRLLRDASSNVLERLKPTEIIEELVELLTDTNPENRAKAAEALGLVGNRSVLPALIMTLYRDPQSYTRCRAAQALGHIGSQEAIQTLVSILEKDGDREVRKSAAEALGIIGSGETPGILLQALFNDRDVVVRAAIAETLGKIGEPSVIQQLEAALDTEKSGAVRWRIVLALGRLQGADASNIIIEALANEEDKNVRESAAEALGLIGTPSCVAALIEALASDKSPGVRASAADALGVIEDSKALPALIKALVSDEADDVRGRAAFALGRLKNVEAIPYLVAAFNVHKQSVIRGNVAYALGQIGGDEAIPFLVQALAFDKDSYVRYRVAEVLGSVGNVITVPHLKSALRDEGSYYGWKVKDKAYEALEKISRRFHVRITWTTDQEEE